MSFGTSYTLEFFWQAGETPYIKINGVAETITEIVVGDTEFVTGSPANLILGDNMLGSIQDMVLRLDARDDDATASISAYLNGNRSA